jgi:hypothetical protein
LHPLLNADPIHADLQPAATAVAVAVAVAVVCHDSSTQDAADHAEVDFAGWKSAVREPEIDIRAECHHILKLHGCCCTM